MVILRCCLIHEARKTYKKRTLAVVFVSLEVISITLEIFGTKNLAFPLASFLLSAFGVVMNFFVVEEATEGHQLTSVEIVFSFTQLILTYIDLVMKILHVKTNYNTYKASVFPLVLAIIVLFFAFKTNEEDEEEEVSDQPDVNDPETLHNTQRSPQQRVEIINTRIIKHSWRKKGEP
ncbi:hypothetical protein ACOSQ4_003944 [Xanthoceras sorbifolium]